MIHLRIVSPEDRTEQVRELLCGDRAVTNVVVLPGAAVRPAGDLLLADVAREDASILVSDLKQLGIHEDGAIALETVETAISPGAKRAIEAAEGDEADAVVWEQVETRTSEEAALSGTFLAFMVLATMIAAVGLFLDNPILIVGAMVVGPEFGPLAGLCVAIVRGQRELALRSGRALAIGFPVAIAAAFVLSVGLDVTGLEPASFDPDEGLAKGIASPDAYTVIVAACAGVAGMLSLSTAKSGALIGVLISVTTIPAAADVSVSASQGDWGNAAGALGQLALNLGTIVVAGLVTLYVQRALFLRRRRRHLAERASGSRRATTRPPSSYARVRGRRS